jgi:tetratricopeptide (TPR) repeat protein
MTLNAVLAVSATPGKNKYMRLRTFLFLLSLVLVAGPLGARPKKTLEKVVAPVESKIRSLSENDQRIFDYCFQEALNLKQQYKYDAAYDLFRFCLSLDSLNAQTWYELSVFYNNLKQNDLGLRALEKAFSLEKDNETYALALANMYLSQQKVNQAIVQFESLVKTNSDDENMLYQLANLYGQTGKYKEAIRVYDQVEQLIGKNESVSFEKYKLYKQAGNPRKAIREVESLCADFPYDVEYVLLLGDAWMDLGNTKKALLQYDAARSMDARNPSVALSFADYYNAIGDTVSAQKQLILALTNPDTDVDTKLNIFTPILNAFMGTADSVNIPKYFDTLLEQHPNEYKLRHLHVQWLLQKGKKQEAKNELRTVLDLNPNQLQAWIMYLELNAEADNQLELRKICTEALTYFPKESIFWFYQGLSWISDEGGLTDDRESHLKAIEAFQKAVDVAKPDDKGFISRVNGFIGDSYLAIKEKVTAFDYYEKALAVNPGNVLVLNNYAYYLSEEGGDLAKAEKMSRATIEAEPKNATYLDTFAWIFFKEGKYSLAKIYIERAIANELDPSSVILEHYGDILWFNGEQDAARAQWKKATGLEDPSERLLEKVETGKYVKP